VELPGKVISFYIVPLDPAYKAGLAGHVPVKIQMPNERQNGSMSKLSLLCWILSFEF
jgi:hypothetical protein